MVIDQTNIAPLMIFIYIICLLLAISLVILINYIQQHFRALRRDITTNSMTEDEVKAMVQHATTNIQRVADETIERFDTEMRVLENLVAAIETREAHLEALLAQRADSLAALPPAEAIDTPALPTPTAVVAPCDEVDDRRAEVFRLANEGRPSSVIAQALSISRGEVDLLLNLRRPVLERAHGRAANAPTMAGPELQTFFIEEEQEEGEPLPLRPSRMNALKQNADGPGNHHMV